MFALKEVKAGAPLGEEEAPGDDVLEMLERDSDFEVGGERNAFVASFLIAIVEYRLREESRSGIYNWVAGALCTRAQSSHALALRVAVGAGCTLGLLPVLMRSGPRTTGSA